MDKELYKDLELETIEFEGSDIITSSDPETPAGGGD